MNIGLHLKRGAMWYPDRIALADKNARLTYVDVYRRVNRLSNALLGLGLEKGDRVAMLSKNRYQLVEALFAGPSAGLVNVPLNARLSVSELVHMLNNSEASALILGPEFVKDIAEARPCIETVEHFIAISDAPADMLDYEDLLARASETDPPAQAGLDDLATLNYTSGTSGVLKAAMLSHRARLCMGRKFLVVPDSDIDRDTVMCHVGPVTHASGGMIQPTWWRGGCNLILEGFDLELLFRTIEQERVTHLFAVPTMINFMMAWPERTKYDISSIRTIVYGASPMPVERIKEALDIFGPVLIQGYGQTETASGFTFLNKEDHLFEGDPLRTKRLASAGRPSTEVDVQIVDEEGRELGVGEIGEIIERGDDSMMGYWKDPDLTAETLRNGWVFTRDMGYMDEGGYIFIVDRKSDMIISGGFNIYPTEVENALYQHPAVFDAAVIAVPDDQWGEAVKAVVVLRPDVTATEAEIIEHCKNNLASFKKPKSVDFVRELPRNPYGKLLRRLLKEPYWQDKDRRVH